MSGAPPSWCRRCAHAGPGPRWRRVPAHRPSPSSYAHRGRHTARALAPWRHLSGRVVPALAGASVSRLCSRARGNMRGAGSSPVSLCADSRYQWRRRRVRALAAGRIAHFHAAGWHPGGHDRLCRQPPASRSRRGNRKGFLPRPKRRRHRVCPYHRSRPPRPGQARPNSQRWPLRFFATDGEQ
jgi:hypothetical protein